VPVPILKQGDFLIASIQAALTDHDLLQLRDELADRVGRYRARGVVIDVTSLDVLDSFASRTIRGIAHTTRLRGAETVVLEDVATALDLEEGLDLLRRAPPRGGRRVG
jgi:rsbT antagonist protein RsbS